MNKSSLPLHCVIFDLEPDFFGPIQADNIIHTYSDLCVVLLTRLLIRKLLNVNSSHCALRRSFPSTGKLVTEAEMVAVIFPCQSVLFNMKCSGTLIPFEAELRRSSDLVNQFLLS